jgi:23S rRNA-/tRNA-specific pseudouridylate synthase
VSAPLPEVLYRDEDLFVVAKPPGLPTTSPDGKNCLAHLVASRLDPGAPHAHPSSRLDRDVTGVVIFARTDRGIRALLDARAAGTYLRSYRAIVMPAPSAEDGEWDWRIAIDPREPRLRITLGPGERGERAQEARSAFSVLERAAGCALLDVRPFTGRTHQIRAHCARAGSPIVGDAPYSGVRRVTLADGRVLHAPRVMLHCARVSIEGMGTFEAPLPSDFARLWSAVRAADPPAA